jgi:hypothetical protein
MCTTGHRFSADNGACWHCTGLILAINRTFPLSLSSHFKLRGCELSLFQSPFDSPLLSINILMDQVHRETLSRFREELFRDRILNEGDTIGTDDETLLQVLFRDQIRLLTRCYCQLTGDFCGREILTSPIPRRCSKIVKNGAKVLKALA